MDKTFLEEIISEETAGKNAAIHAYDKMMWTVRSGYLTLVFGAWSLLIQSAVKQKIDFTFLKPYLILLASLTIVISIGAFLIDRNYARRKFRVIHAVNELMHFKVFKDVNKMEKNEKDEIASLLKISGDTANKTYRLEAFANEITVSRIIFFLPVLLVITLVIILYTNH